MSQFPPESPYDPPAQPFGPGGDPPKAGNGMAVASLVCGLLGCVPFLTSLLAIVFGFLGLGKTKDPRVGGKGMSIAGLILGILGIGAWSVIALSLLAAGPAIQAGIQAALMPQQFVQELASGNVDGALAMTTGVDKEKIQAAVDEVKPWGAFKSFQLTGNNTRVVNNSAESDMTGQVVFEKATKSATFTLVNTGNPTDLKAIKFKIKSWTFQ